MFAKPNYWTNRGNPAGNELLWLKQSSNFSSVQERRSLTFSIFGFVTLLKQYCVLLIKHAPGEFHLCYTKGLLTYRFKNLTAVQSAVGSTCLIPFIGPLSPPNTETRASSQCGAYIVCGEDVKGCTAARIMYLWGHVCIIFVLWTGLHLFTAPNRVLTVWPRHMPANKTATLRSRSTSPTSWIKTHIKTLL